MHYTTYEEMQKYLTTVPVGSIHIAKYPSGTYTRQVGIIAACSISGKQLDNLGNTFAYHLDATSWQATELTHLGDTLDEAKTNYPEYFL